MKINVNAVIGWSAIVFIAVMFALTVTAFLYRLPVIVTMLTEVPQ